MNSGYTSLSVKELLLALLRKTEGDPIIIMWGIRMPRIVIALIVGAGLALSGVIIQGVSQNALADPGILGINSGAGLGIVIYITLFYGKTHLAPTYALPIAAFVGASIAAILVFTLARKKGKVTPARLLLIGIAVGAGISAAMLFFTYRMDAYSYDFIKIWVSGSIWGMNWQYVTTTLLWFIVIAPIVFYYATRLNVLHLGDEMATGLGASVQRDRRILLLLAVGLAASAVAVAGSISFVGLIAPHIARRFAGATARRVIPLACIIGALLVLVADTIGRTIAQPIDIPVGIVVAAIGGPYFLYQLVATRVKL